MADDIDAGVTATSALVGGVATLVQELVVAGAVDATRLRARLQAFTQQDSVQNESPSEKELIGRVIGTLMQAIDLAEQERGGK